MGRDIGIADRLRAFGVRVVEVDGWRDRGSSDFNPRGSVNHHTAGSASGNIPSLDTLIYGRNDLPGPLCNVALARNLDAYVIAAGRANHAGEGGWRGLSGNSSVWGLEVENVGTSAEPSSEADRDTMARIHAALLSGTAHADMNCQHKEWAPNRKPDFHDVSGDDLRNRVNWYLGGGGQPPPTNNLRRGMFALVQPDTGVPGHPGPGIYRFSGQGMIGVPTPNALGGDQIMLAVLGLDATVWQVSKEWFDTWPLLRG